MPRQPIINWWNQMFSAIGGIASRSSASSVKNDVVTTGSRWVHGAAMADGGRTRSGGGSNEFDRLLLLGESPNSNRYETMDASQGILASVSPDLRILARLRPRNQKNRHTESSRRCGTAFWGIHHFESRVSQYDEYHDLCHVMRRVVGDA